MQVSQAGSDTLQAQASLPPMPIANNPRRRLIGTLRQSIKMMHRALFASI